MAAVGCMWLGAGHGWTSRDVLAGFGCLRQIFRSDRGGSGADELCWHQGKCGKAQDSSEMLPAINALCPQPGRPAEGCPRDVAGPLWPPTSRRHGCPHAAIAKQLSPSLQG